MGRAVVYLDRGRRARAPSAWRSARADESPAAFSASLAFVSLATFAFGRKAFCNYYFFVIGALCCAVAAAAPPRAPLTAPRTDP